MSFGTASYNTLSGSPGGSGRHTQALACSEITPHTCFDKHTPHIAAAGLAVLLANSSAAKSAGQQTYTVSTHS
jgi:hypothetical protein